MYHCMANIKSTGYIFGRKLMQYLLGMSHKQIIDEVRMEIICLLMIKFSNSFGNIQKCGCLSAKERGLYHLIRIIFDPCQKFFR